VMPKLRLRAGAGAQAELLASGPDGAWQPVLEAGGTLDPVAIATFGALAVKLEGRLRLRRPGRPAPARAARHRQAVGPAASGAVHHRRRRRFRRAARTPGLGHVSRRRGRPARPPRPRLPGPVTATLAGDGGAGADGAAADLAAPELAVQIERLTDDGQRLGRAQDVLDHDRLVLEDLVVLKEALDLAGHVGGQLLVIGVVAEGRVADADGDDLVVDPLVVAHSHQADGARLDDGQRVDGILAEHQRVQRIAVIAEAARDEAVVGGIVDGAVKDAVQAEEARLLVQLVLVLAALRNLDDDGKGTVNLMIVDVDVMPGMHGTLLSDPSCQARKFATRRGSGDCFHHVNRPEICGTWPPVSLGAT
jgi:hypothetical protein